MGVEFTVRERSALYAMLADNPQDIILKSDPRGFIVTASPALATLGVSLPTLLFGPHIRDLFAPRHAPAIEAAHAAALAGQDLGLREFPVRQEAGRHGWFDVRMRGLRDLVGRPYGVLSVLRSVTERKRLEEQLFVAELTDPLTGLTNRVAFTSMLDFLIDNSSGGSLAVFDLDHFMTLNMRHGQDAGDALLCDFADLLRGLTGPDEIISRIGSERFALLLPRSDAQGTLDLCQPIIEALAEFGKAGRGGEIAVTASAGIAPIAGSVDHTLRQAEIALVLAKAKGRSRVETSAIAGRARPFEARRSLAQGI